MIQKIIGVSMFTDTSLVTALSSVNLRFFSLMVIFSSSLHLLLIFVMVMWLYHIGDAQDYPCASVVECVYLLEIFLERIQH